MFNYILHPPPLESDDGEQLAYRIITVLRDGTALKTEMKP